MLLIGMLDSPYVRRVAVSLKTLGLPYEHRLLSVFRDFAEFSALNPVVKAPTLITDDGVTLMDSTLILAHIERIAPRSLMPEPPHAHAQALRLIGLALAACDKNVQIVYEQHLRPAEKQHQPWLDRVSGQLLAAWRPLEDAASRGLLHAGGDMMQPDITVAVAWRFAQSTVPEIVAADAHPALTTLSARAEALPAFAATFMAFKT